MTPTRSTRSTAWVAAVLGMSLALSLSQVEARVRPVLKASGSDVCDNSGPASGYPKMKANVGDEIRFSLAGNHNIVRMDNPGCTPGMTLDTMLYQSKAMTFQQFSYEVTEVDLGDKNSTMVYFKCSTGYHCQQGQYLEVEVVKEKLPDADEDHMDEAMENFMNMFNKYNSAAGTSGLLNTKSLVGIFAGVLLLLSMTL